MQTFIANHKLLSILLLVSVAFALCIIFQLLWLRYNGTTVAPPTISRSAQRLGSGPPLTFAVLGDSTSISQGSAYDEGYAVAAAGHLAAAYTVTWANFGVSGARAQDVAEQQAPEAAKLAPDIALVAVGANDVTHLTPFSSVEQSLVDTVRQLRKANPDVLVLVTGSPDMGSPRRLPQPLRWIAGERTKSLNEIVARLADSEHLTFVPIAAETGPAFRKDATLFAADNFHPNAAGYALWKPVVIRAIDRSLQ